MGEFKVLKLSNFLKIVNLIKKDALSYHIFIGCNGGAIKSVEVS